MQITYIHHSGFLVETDRFYYVFDYESGDLPEMDPEKPVFVLSSHSHGDHYNPEVFSKLAGMRHVRAILSDDIVPPAGVDTLSVSPGKTYSLHPGLTLHTFHSTDLGVAFLVEDGENLIYHAGDLNDWVWEEESDDYNAQMTLDYREQMDLLAQTLNHREMDAAFVKAAEQAGFVNLKGHRTVGGMRASIYNAMPIEGVEKLVTFMEKYEKTV